MEPSLLKDLSAGVFAEAFEVPFAGTSLLKDPSAGVFAEDFEVPFAGVQFPESVLVLL